MTALFLYERDGVLRGPCNSEWRVLSQVKHIA